MNIRVEINETENTQTIEEINETKTLLFEKINIGNKSLDRLIQGKKRKDTNYQYQE